jgi:MipA family protein
LKRQELVLIVVLTLVSGTSGAVIDIQLDDLPASGSLICLLYNSANSFGDLRESFRSERFTIGPDKRYRVTDIPAGDYALVAFLDDNGNGFLDKNFIGIPREPMAFSQQYRPKGPPSYERARFTLKADETRVETMSLERVLGKRGRIGVGISVIGRSSPYRDYSGGVYRPIPAVTYMSERFQVLGPNVNVGLLGSGKARLAGTLEYRIGVYEEDDSDYLRGMGDRRDTGMLGLALQAELWGGLDAKLGYQHDVLDQIGGGDAQLSLGKTFQSGIARLTPSIGLNWLSSKLSNYDYGVSNRQARAGRPAYKPEDAWNPEVGFSTFLELSREWLIVGSVAAELLDDDIRDSPIVSEDYVLKGFLAVSYLF